MKVEANKGLPEGKHTGTTVRIEEKDAKNKEGKPLGFKYLELYVQPEGGAFDLKYSMPAKMNIASKLGRTCALFMGRELRVDEEVDPAKVLVGKKCTFLTQDEVTAKGTFSRIVEDSLKPLK